MLAIVHSATLLGVRGRPVRVEVHVSSGLPSFTVVGLPDAACRESRDRVRAALITSGLQWPSNRITVNLAPSGVRKVGAGLDLAIAVGVLVASGQLDTGSVADLAFIGELGLDGAVRPVVGALPLTAACERTRVVVALPNHAEACLVPGVEIRPASLLVEVVAAVRGEGPWSEAPPPAAAVPADRAQDLSRVKGQPLARRAVEVAAAGGHHLLMVGPPGAGKTMLAKSLAGLLPPLSADDALEVTTVHSAAGTAPESGGLLSRPPFRAPHHTASVVSLVGGGTRSMRPGEISCAHGGVLFLDELAEFPAAVLDALRQPLEEGVVRVSRAYGSVSLPARVLLVAAMNPCPCGQADTPGRCRCSEGARLRYARRISGPLLDRFDIRIHVGRPPVAALFSVAEEESTAEVAARVARARCIATDRGTRCNAAVETSDLDAVAPLTAAARTTLRNEMETGAVTARGLHRIRRVARTVADLEGDLGPVDEGHVASALALRADPFGSAGPNPGVRG